MLDDYQQIASSYVDWARLGAEVDFVAEHLDADATVERAAGAQVLVAMRERTPLPAEVLDRLPDLELIVTTGGANASIDVAHAAARGITVCGTGARPAPPAELTWALILALLRTVPAADRAIREGAWQDVLPGTELAGSTLGLIGLGRLGQRVARVAAAFDMEVLAWSQHLDPDLARGLGIEPCSKEDLLRRSDVVSLHLRLSDRTRGVLGATELALMKPSAILVNTSRGPLVDEARPGRGAGERHHRRCRTRCVRRGAAPTGPSAALGTPHGADAPPRLRHRVDVPGVLRRHRSRTSRPGSPEIRSASSRADRRHRPFVHCTDVRFPAATRKGDRSRMSRNLSPWRALVAMLALLAAGLVWSPPAAADTTWSGTLTQAIAHIPVAGESRTGYERTKFHLWIDADGDGCDTRDEVLISEAEDAPTVGSGCSLTGGRWYSYYDGVSQTERLGPRHRPRGAAGRGLGLRRRRVDRAASRGLRQRPRRQPHPRRRHRLAEPQQGRSGRRGVDAAD